MLEDGKMTEEEEAACGEPRLECEMEEVGLLTCAKPCRELRKIDGSIALQLTTQTISLPTSQPIHH